jgi:hypothetical protein
MRYRRLSQSRQERLIARSAGAGKRTGPPAAMMVGVPSPSALQRRPALRRAAALTAPPCAPLRAFISLDL